MITIVKVCDREIRIEGRLLRIARPHGDRYRFLDDPAVVLDGLRQCGTRVDLFSFAQRLPETKPKYPYPMEWDNFAVLPISTFDHWWTKQIDTRPGTGCGRRRRRGSTLREVPFDDALVKGIWEIYNECPVRQGRRFPHYGKDIETVYREEATHLDCSIFIGAFLGDKLIGFAKLVHDETRTQAGLMNIVSMIQHRDKAPTERPDSASGPILRRTRDPLSRVLEVRLREKADETASATLRNVNGFQRIDLPRYYVPLTRWVGLPSVWGCTTAWLTRLPDSLAAKLRDLRAAWYNRRYTIHDGGSLDRPCQASLASSQKHPANAPSNNCSPCLGRFDTSPFTSREHGATNPWACT